ncbi:hypothetical protein GCM10017556_33570 [Micromonospora sagamiensis]|nr:hypothetical protein GCM10017556_33570 [Micromonospora sagamiensis]
MAAVGQRQRTRHVDFSITVDGMGLGQPRPSTVTLRNFVTVTVGARSVTKVLVGALAHLRDSRWIAVKSLHAPHTSYTA